MDERAIFIYDSQDDFQLLKDPKTDKRCPIKLEGLQCFDWSPKDDIISAWIPEKKDSPARLQLIEVPSRKEIAAKNLFSVRDASLYWQSEGDYLCVNVTRLSKSK